MERREVRRIAANEAAFRQINEGIQRGQWPGEERELVAFRCECARLGCTVMVELTPAEYERIRSRSRQFVVATGHEIPDAETVVARGHGYVVVEKRAQAGALASESDPRA